MPQMGVSVAEGTVVEWRKQPGDWVEADEVIAAISTDKIDTDVEAPAAGRLQEIIVAEGETVDVGAVLALIATDAKPGEAHTSEGTSEAEVALEAPGDAGDLPGDTDTRHTNGSAQKRDKRYSPVVMRMAAEHDLDLSQIEGTGRGGRVRKQDVLAFLEREPSRGGATSGDERSEEDRPMHIESPYKPDAPPPPKRVAAPAPDDRPRDGRVAADGGDVHDDRRGGHDPRRDGARGAGPDVAPDRRPRDDRDAAGVPRAQRHARGRRVHPPRRRAPRHRRLAGRGGADRPGDSRRAGAVRGGPVEADQGALEGRTGQRADAGRRPRRHVHDHQPRRLRLDHRH